MTMYGLFISNENSVDCGGIVFPAGGFMWVGEPPIPEGTLDRVNNYWWPFGGEHSDGYRGTYNPVNSKGNITIERLPNFKYWISGCPDNKTTDMQFNDGIVVYANGSSIFKTWYTYPSLLLHPFEITSILELGGNDVNIQFYSGPLEHPSTGATGHDTIEGHSAFYLHCYEIIVTLLAPWSFYCEDRLIGWGDSTYVSALSHPWMVGGYSEETGYEGHDILVPPDGQSVILKSTQSDIGIGYVDGDIQGGEYLIQSLSTVLSVYISVKPDNASFDGTGVEYSSYHQSWNITSLFTGLTPGSTAKIWIRAYSARPTPIWGWHNIYVCYV